jgi:hypothetical protein
MPSNEFGIRVGCYFVYLVWLVQFLTETVVKSFMSRSEEIRVL